MTPFHPQEIHTNTPQSGVDSMSLGTNAAFPLPRPHEVGLEAAMLATLEYSRVQGERVMGRALGHQ